MALDLYEPCTCGSGKKFKWCCHPIFVNINRAWEQEASGQHEAALRLIDQVVREHEGNPEAWGQKARLLYSQGKIEEADSALQKAFDLNPNYPAGLLLRAYIRFQEGEVRGALLLARRAAEAYHPDARPYLAEVYLLLFECEMRMNRPAAARAALRLSLRFAPGEEQVQKSFDDLFGPEGRLPAVARRDYTFRTGGMTAPARHAAVPNLDSPRLGDLVHVFEPLTKQDPNDAAAWFNLGLAHAWLGDNAAALEALRRYVELETDENAASEAAALMEVLRCGQGLEDESDYQEHTFAYQFRDPQPIVNLLQEWERGRRLVPLQAQQEGMFMALILELSTAGLITVGAPASDVGRLGGYVVILGNLLQFTSPLKEPFERLRDEVRQRLSLGLTDLQERLMPMQFQDVTAEALLFPLQKADDNPQRVLDHIQKHYEETWVHKPRRALSGNTPLDAAAHPMLRKHLRGVVQFIQDCAKGGMIANYDFDRLRRKLGLLAPPSAIRSPLSDQDTAGQRTADSGQRIAEMGTAELAALGSTNLSDEQLEQAYQTAVKLDAEELAANFARQLIARPLSSERLDRFPWYSYLSQHALRSGDKDGALDYINEGEKADCEHNEGRRRNEYELRRGQIHVKRGEVEQAAEVFQRLIERVPNNFRYRGSAAESMLSLRQPARALRFAEEGVAAARQANDRDSERYLQELAAAAKKQMG
jgi:tetratricopeptide (TPR) repeat protein